MAIRNPVTLAQMTADFLIRRPYHVQSDVPAQKIAKVKREMLSAGFGLSSQSVTDCGTKETVVSIAAT